MRLFEFQMFKFMLDFLPYLYNKKERSERIREHLSARDNYYNVI